MYCWWKAIPYNWLDWWKKQVYIYRIHLTMLISLPILISIFLSIDPITYINIYSSLGPSLERLEPSTATELLMRFIGFLKTHSFIGTNYIQLNPSFKLSLFITIHYSYYDSSNPILLFWSSIYLDNVFPWIHQALDRSILPLSKQQIKQQLRRVLQDLSAMPNQHGIEASELLERVNRHILQLPN